MRRLLSFIVIFIFIGVTYSCSTSQMSQQKNGQKVEKQQYPSWYSDKKIVSTESRIFCYATAIGKDSVSAVSKAVEWAQAELKSGISNKLEVIRSEAVVEYGSDSGLDDPRFLIALRKVTRAVDPLVKTGKTEAKTVDGYSSVRSFAEVSVPKDQLIERIGKRLGAYEKEWEALIKSKAFSNF